MKKFLLLLLPLLLSADISSWKLFEGKKSFEHIEFLDAKVLRFDKIGKEKFFGISALEYDKKTHTLYMLSDRSRLFWFDLEIKNGKLLSLKPKKSCRLQKPNGKYFFRWQSDSEGLVKRGRYFYASYEGIYPQIKKFNSQCREVGRIKLAKVLRNYRNYQGKNRGLESLDIVRGYGFVTAPEKRLKKTHDGWHSLYNSRGKICEFKLDDKKLSLVDIESDGKGSVIGLFRRLDAMNLGFVVALKKIKLQKSKCKVQNLATLKSVNHDHIDNFEGITKVGKNLYVMISDDNDNFFEETLLVLFKVK